MMTPEQRRAYYEANRERIKAKSRAYYQEHRDERIAYAAAYKRGHRRRPSSVPASCHPERSHFAFGKCQPCYHRDYYRANRDKWRREFGYGPGEYDRMLREQDGRCAICGDATTLVPDHDHESGLARSLLCQPCNQALGMFCDDPNILASAAEYVAAHRRLRVIA